MLQRYPIRVFDIVRRQKNMDNRNDKELSCQFAVILASTSTPP